MRALFLVPVAIALSGCARWVVFGHTFGPSGSEPAVQQLSPASRSLLKGVTVALTLPAQEEAAADRRFKQDDLVAAMESELRARKLLAEGAVKAERTVGIIIDDFATRPSTNAVIFGNVISEGILTGSVDVRDTTGKQLRAFRITAKSRLVTPASGEDNHALHALYEKFANLAVDTLSGTTGKPNDVTNREAPR